MYGRSRLKKTMKWVTLFKVFKDKVGLSQVPSSASTSPPLPFEESSSNANNASPPRQDFSLLLSRDKTELELDFKRYWEEFGSSSTEKEKEKALHWTVEYFCRLVKQQSDAAQLITMLVETHIFSFVVGRAFVTDIEKLKLSSKTRSLEAEKVLTFFSETTKDGIRPGANLLQAVEVLVSGVCSLIHQEKLVDKQSFLDSGILCCLIHVLNALLAPDGGSQRHQLINNEEQLSSNENHDVETIPVRRHEVEGSVIHIMKALAGHPSAAQSLVDDNSLQLLFQMVANGSSVVFSQYKEGLVPLHAIQLHRHAMQILRLLLVNDNGSTAKYIRKHQLIRVLLMAVKDFNPDCGDPAYTVGIVDLLLESVELSYRPDAGGIRLREDIHNAHGYQFLVQFALTLSKSQGGQTFYSKPLSENDSAKDSSHAVEGAEKKNLGEDGEIYSPLSLSPALSRLLDIIISFAQTGPSCAPGSSGLKSSKSSHPKSNAHGRSRSSFSDRVADEILEKDTEKVKDLEAVQMLMDILMKAESTELQAEVLNRLLKIFSSHPENYKLCQQLRTVPLLILNMAGFPSSLQEIILKILEYAVSVVNIIPEQELLSLCCLLPQSITSELKHTILSFFLKLLSFDQEYKKILREVGVLELLLEDLKQHTFLHEPEQLTSDHGQLEIKTSSSSFKRHFLSKDSILSSPTLLEPACGKFLIFEVEDTAAVAWDCLLSLLKKSDANQAAFRSFNGVIILLPFLASDVHRPGVLRVLSCLIIEDVKQTHPEELGALIEVLRSGMVTSALGSQYILQHDAECDTFGAVWRILRVNDSAQRVFGEATGFSLLLAVLQSFQSDDGESKKQPSITVCINVFTYMLRVMTAGVFDNAVNRSKLHTILSSHTFYDLLSRSGLICVEYECQVIQFLLELALEVVTPPFTMSEHENESAGFLLITLSGSFVTYKKRVYNAAAVRVLLRFLLLFTPNVQLELLNFIEKLACANSLNKENLTSIGCVELLLEIIHPLMSSSSSLVSHALKIVEVLGAYRLSVSELRSLVRYIIHMRLASSARCVVQMMGRLIVSEDTGSGDVSLAPFVELDMSKLGHASIQVPLGQRSWPPAAGYSFVCWFQYQNLLKPQARETEAPKAGSPKRHSLISGQLGAQVLRIFSVGSVDNESTFYTELCLHDDGVLTLATSNSSSLTFAGLEMEEGRWHHLAVVHSKPNALAGLFQASFAYVYLNGKLRHTGKLGYSPSPAGKSVQVTIGTPVACARVSDLSWKLRSCFLFEEVLPPGSICFMYILGRGYRGLFQDTNLLQFVSNQACGGGSMAILDSLDTDLPSPSNTQKPDTAGKQGIFKVDGSGFVWDSYKLGNLSLQLWGKKLILALDGTSTETIRASGTLSMLNLVDPLSATASSIWGIPRFGRLLGDIYICKQCMISDTIRPIGGMAVVLALIEAAETRDMLHMSLTLLACALHQNPQNVRDMQKYRGYHLLALFLHRRMSLFDMQSLEIFFQIAACEATFSEPRKIGSMKSTLSPTTINEASFDDLNLSKLPDEFSSVGSQGDIDDFSATKDSFSHISELENADMPTETSNCIVLSNTHMVEHVLLDWTLWVTAPVPIQISLLGFLEHLVSMHWYRNHNLTILRKINLVQHLLVTLQRGDVEVPVLEKVVMLLGVILEDGFLPSELELVMRFVIMTFDPPEPTSRNHFTRESMGKHVIVRNMLLEMLIDLQVTIPSEELLEQWHRIVSSKLITYFLDEALHPTSMRWIMTLVGVCLSFSPTFALKFRSSGGYQGLVRVLPSFYDSPDIYYILFCLIFGKPVYPRLPEVRMLDFHALMPSDGRYGELKFVELLDSVIAMAKSTFDRLCTHLMIAHQTGNLSQVGASIMADLVDGHVDMGELQGEALMHKTYAARLMGGEASAPAAATSVLRFMVDLAKTCPPFSAVCRRAEFLESCIDLYFSCVRAAHAVRMTKELTVKTEEKILNDADDTSSSQNTFSSFPQEHEQPKSCVSIGSFVQGHVSASTEDNPIFTDNMANEKPEIGNSITQQELDQLMKENVQAVASVDSEAVDQVSTATSGSNDFNFRDTRSTLDHFQKSASHNSLSFTISESPVLTERSSSRIQRTPSSSPVLALTSWLGGPSRSDSRAQSSSTPSVDSFMSAQDMDSPSEFKPATQSQYASNTLFTISPSLILEVDGSGYGGGPCSAGATAVLDFLAEVLSDFVTEQIKAASVLETILESVPMHADAESVLVFQGLCLTRLMNFVERRLLRDDEENEKRLEKSRWSLNLDALSWMIVDRVYMGAFPQPAGVLKTLEFLLSMLQLANKDGRIEETIPAGKGLLSLGRGNRQLDTYIHALFKNTNRIILFCFLPSFLSTIGEDDLLTRLCLQNEPKKKLSLYSSPEDGGVEILTVLQLLVANRRIIFCPSNRDTDLNCCLCINLISLLYDHRKHVQNAAIDILKYLLVHRRAALEEFLVSKVNQGPSVDALHGGFDKLLTGNLSVFFQWLHSSESIVNKVLEKGAAVMWAQYIAGSTKFPGVRIKGMDSRRKREMGRKSRDISKLEQRHWEQVNERRSALELVRDAMATELRVIRQDKYGWVVHAESEWQTHLQQLTHERGIFPINKSSMNEEELEWQLCPIEGPYRMRKKLERCRTKIDTIQNILNGKFEIGEREFENTDNEHHAFDAESDSFLNLSTDKPKNETFNAELYNEPTFKESEDAPDVASPVVGWNDDLGSSINEASMHSAAEFGERSSDASAQRADTSRGKPDLGSSKLSSSVKNDEVRVAEDKSDKELNDNGEYLIRPYLEPLERIKCRYNCERVVGLDKHDGIFLIGELSLYIIENFYIDESGCICEKESEDELSIIDQALGVKKDFSCNMDSVSKSSSSWGATLKAYAGGRAWAYNGGAWGKEKVCNTGNAPHPWRNWKLDSVHELLKRDYQLRPVAIEIFSMDGCNDLLVFHKKEREEVYKNLVAMNLPRNSILDATITGSTKQESNEGRLFKVAANSFSKRWQTGEISNFQYIMHLNTLAGRGYSDLTQYPVFPWVLADYESENLDLLDPKTFRNFEKPMGCQTSDREEEFRKRYEGWDDPEIPKFHYGSHYSSAGIVLFYLLRLPPFSAENQKLQGGQFDHADRLFNNVRETWWSAAGKGNTSDVKELIPEFFYMPEFLENKFNLDFGEKQSGDKVGDVVLPPWAKGSAREFIRKHREALESDYVSEHLHHWIDLIFGYKQRGKAAEDAVNVFYYYTYEGSVDIDSVTDPMMKASVLAQINHFGQTPKQLFMKPHAKRRTDRKLPPHPLKHAMLLVPHEIRKSSSSISQIVTVTDKVLIAGTNILLKPRTFTKCVAWGFPDRSLRFISYNHDRLLSTHEDLHHGNQIQCVSASHDGQLLVTGADDGLLCAWRIGQAGPFALRHLQLEKALCGHTGKITCLRVNQPYMMIVSGSDDCTVIIWDLSSLVFIRQLPEFPSPVSAIYVNELNGEIMTAAGVLLAIWSINGDCLAVVNTTQNPSDFILSLTGSTFSDWLETNWYVSGHQSGDIKVWKMVHSSIEESAQIKETENPTGGLGLGGKVPEYRLILHKVLKFHKFPVTALRLSNDLKQLLSGDSDGHLVSWTLRDESLRASMKHR